MIARPAPKPGKPGNTGQPSTQAHFIMHLGETGVEIIGISWDMSPPYTKKRAIRLLWIVVLLC